MTLRLHNSLTGSADVFAPADGRTVRMYSCGLTPYGRAHIGNFRTFVVVDVLRRTLKYVAGLDVRQVMNFTDVDDWTIAGARAGRVSLQAFTDAHIAAFRDDAQLMGLEPVECAPRATEPDNLRAMGDLISRLHRGGHVYRLDGSTYFDVASIDGYGGAAGIDARAFAGRRVDSDNYLEEHGGDFPVWKRGEPDDPVWNVGHGPGRPGWHLECSAMALRLLGEPPVDIQTGGVDLVFPHHANTDAQTRAATGRPFARWAVHVHHVLVDGRKMSKSIGNTYTVPDLAALGHSASAIRWMLLSAHYRSPLEFTLDRLAAATAVVRRIVSVAARLRSTAADRRGDARLSDPMASAERSFAGALLNDLDTTRALDALRDAAEAVERALDAGTTGAASVRAARRALARFGRVLGFSELASCDESSCGPDDGALQSAADALVPGR